MKKLLPMLLCLTMLTGCSGGSIYSNYRELEQITVIQTMGFDSLPDGSVQLSVSSGAGVGGSKSSAKTSCLTASDSSVTLAREKIQDYSASEQLFFAHTSYIAVGESTAKKGLSQYLDYIGRVSDLRLDVPMFAVMGSTAESLVTGAGNKEYDATSVFKSLERNCENRGDCVIFTASDIISSLQSNGCALMTAVRPEKAKNAVEGAGKDELTALPDGYLIIRNSAAIGAIPMKYALGVSMLTGKAGPASLEVSAGEARLTLQLDDCSCDIKPVTENAKLTGLDIKIKLRTALTEISGSTDRKAVEKALCGKIRSSVSEVLNTSRTLRCDFLQLGTSLERKHPFLLHGLAEDISDTLGGLHYNISVDAVLDRSFDLLVS